jgi:hypothetical protein
LLPGVIELGCRLLLDAKDNGVRAADGLKSVHLEDVAAIGYGAAMPDKEAGYLSDYRQSIMTPDEAGVVTSALDVAGGRLMLAVAAAWGQRQSS